MNQTQAIAKLRKALGKNFAYRINKSAKPASEREVAQAKAREVAARRTKADEATKARREELLRNDPEYQRLCGEYLAACKELDALNAVVLAKPITVGISNSLWFSVKAEGDNWAEVVEKITKEA